MGVRAMSEAEPIERAFTQFDIRDRWVVVARIGSDSHGTKIVPKDGGVDDTDYMGIVVPPARDLIGLGTWEGWNYGPDESGLDVCLYSLRKFVSLLLKQNPNVLGMLWLRDEDYVVMTDSFRRLLEIRGAFASKMAYESFAGYARSQLYKMTRNAHKGYMGAKRKSLVDQFGYDTKNAAHLIRLLRMGTEYLRTGELAVHRGAIDADELMSIKRGDWPLERVQALSDELFKDAEAAHVASRLPPAPDFDRAERYLIDEHLRALK